MKMNLGRIGVQEGANLIALTVAVTGIFTVESATYYSNGNSTFITIPMSVLVGLAFFIAGSYAIKKTNSASFCDMLDKSLGKTGGGVVAFVIAFAMLFDAFLLLLRFISMIHSYVFVESSYINVALWVFLPVICIALLGFETLGRMAKVFGLALGILFLFGFVSAVDGFETYRLYPLLGDGYQKVVSDTFKGSYKFIPAFIAPLVLMKGMNDRRSAEKSTLIGAGVGAAFCFITQAVLGMTYEYTSLQNMYFPLCRLNMSLQNEDYFMRTDKVGIFLWLVGAVITVAFYIYCAGFIFCKKTDTKDIRPCITCFTAILASCALAEYTKLYTTVHQIITIVERYAFVVLLAFIAIAVIAALIKSRREGGT